MSDLESEIDIGPQLIIEYDKSGRAACKSARCLYDHRAPELKLAEAGNKKAKSKGAKIDKGVIRVVKKVSIAAFRDHEVSSNYHLACFMMEQTHARPSTSIVKSSDQFMGIDKLKRSEQELVDKMLERSCQLWDRWKKHNTRRSFTDEEIQERADEAQDWLAMVAGDDVEERKYDYDQDDVNKLKKAVAAKRKSLAAADDDDEDGPAKKKKKTPAKKKKSNDDDDEESDYGDPDRHTDVEESPEKKPAIKRETKTKREVKDEDDGSSNAKKSTVKKEGSIKSEAKSPVKPSASAASTYDSSAYELEEIADAATKKKEMYRALLSRPSTLGMTKSVPDGADDCLAGLTFVISGVLDSLTTDEAKDLIQKYGGRVTGGVSKKTTYLLKGDQAGETKTRKAQEVGTKIIDEDGLFNLISTLPEGGNPSAAPKAKKARAKPKKKGCDYDEEEEDEVIEKPKLKKPAVPGGRALPSFL